MSGPGPLSVAAWAGRLGGRLRGGAARALVHGLSDDSRAVREGDLFFARRGTAADGAAYAREALARGAVAVVGERPPDEDLPWIAVPAVDLALTHAADLFFGRPQDALRLVGVTGTKGKTTIAWLAAKALGATGTPAAVLGTIRHDLGPAGVAPAANTTPGRLELRRLLARARDAGCGAAVMEVSSHALAQGRTEGLSFDVAVFSNLGRDHLDYHPDEEAYFRAKARLFEGLGEESHAVLARDEACYERLAGATRARVFTYGFGEGADLVIDDLRLGLDGTEFSLRRKDGPPVPIRTPLIGRHNALNLAAAIAAASCLGADVEEAARGAASLSGVPGRLERVAAGPDDDVTAFVDYAHTDEALREVLSFLRAVGADPLVCVVGCGGDRDRSKRPRMARSAADLADRVYLTSDNPRTEDPLAILADMEAGLASGTRDRASTLENRRDAIRRAVLDAAPGTTLLVAGKGHEKVQILADRRIPFDDVEETRSALAARARRRAEDRAATRS